MRTPTSRARNWEDIPGRPRLRQLDVFALEVGPYRLLVGRHRRPLLEAQASVGGQLLGQLARGQVAEFCRRQDAPLIEQASGVIAPLQGQFVFIKGGSYKINIAPKYPGRRRAKCSVDPDFDRDRRTPGILARIGVAQHAD